MTTKNEKAVQALEKKLRKLEDERRSTRLKLIKLTAEERAEKKRAYARAYYAGHKEEKKAAIYAWRARNPERVAAHNDKWKEAHPDQWKEIQQRSVSKWKKAHPEKVREYARNARLRRKARIYAANLAQANETNVALTLRAVNKHLGKSAKAVKAQVP